MRSRTTTRQRSAVARLIHWKFVLFLLVLTFLFFAFGRGDEGLYQLWQEWQALEVAQQQVARLQAENDSLRQVLWRLENDLEYVEKVAREEYGMSKQGERIYRLRHSTTKKSKKD